jgi:hypothetical protein
MYIVKIRVLVHSKRKVFLTPRSLKGLAVSFCSDFLSRHVNRVVATLVVAVVPVPFGGPPDLVDLGHVAMCLVFAGFP